MRFQCHAIRFHCHAIVFTAMPQFSLPRYGFHCHDTGFQYEQPERLPTEADEPRSPWTPAVSRVRVLDYVVGGHDRHQWNMIYAPASHEIRGIDYEEDLTGVPAAVRTHPVSGGRLPTAYDGDLARRIRDVTFLGVRAALSDVATPHELECVWLRLCVVFAHVNSRAWYCSSRGPQLPQATHPLSDFPPLAFPLASPGTPTLGPTVGLPTATVAGPPSPHPSHTASPRPQ